jgi:Domain of unknown function DUF29
VKLNNIFKREEIKELEDRIEAKRAEIETSQADAASKLVQEVRQRKDELKDKKRELEIFQDILSCPQKEQLRDNLILLMASVIKWKNLPDCKTADLSDLIFNTRDNIDKLLTKNSDLDREYIRRIQNHCLRKAKERVQAQEGTYNFLAEDRRRRILPFENPLKSRKNQEDIFKNRQSDKFLTEEELFNDKYTISGDSIQIESFIDKSISRGLPLLFPLTALIFAALNLIPEIKWIYITLLQFSLLLCSLISILSLFSRKNNGLKVLFTYVGVLSFGALLLVWYLSHLNAVSPSNILLTSALAF